jgi:hypothetical protein
MMYIYGEEFTVVTLGWLALWVPLALALLAWKQLSERSPKTIWTYAATSVAGCAIAVTFIPVCSHAGRYSQLNQLDPYLLEPIGRLLLDGLRRIGQACCNF